MTAFWDRTHLKRKAVRQVSREAEAARLAARWEVRRNKSME
jgi:hypothetical protein